MNNVKNRETYQIALPSLYIKIQLKLLFSFRIVCTPYRNENPHYCQTTKFKTGNTKNVYHEIDWRAIVITKGLEYNKRLTDANEIKKTTK